MLERISWFLYQKGIGRPNVNYLQLIRFGEVKWFRIAEALMEECGKGDRQQLLDHALQPKYLSGSIGRSRLIKLLSRFLTKGSLDEKRRVAEFMDAHSVLFSAKDEILIAGLLIARATGDNPTKSAAESALFRIRGKDPHLLKLDYLP